MIWDEAMLKYAARRMCDKHRPWDCEKCELRKHGGCQLGILIDTVKEWAEKHLDLEMVARKGGLS